MTALPVGALDVPPSDTLDPPAPVGTLDVPPSDTLDVAALDADVGDALAAGLLGPPPDDLAAFERAFVGLVERGHPDPVRAWDRFYDATLARAAAAWERPEDGPGTVATFGRIWTRAAALTRGGSVLDVGTCFGFLPLAWAARPAHPRLLAADLYPASAALAARQARRLSRDVAVLCADGAALPLPDRAVDTVLLLHVLEHVDRATCARLLREALRVAGRRVVVAVPVEPAPDPVFGHVQVFDLRRLAELGRGTGWRVQLADADGAWLVLDRPSATCGPGARPTARPGTPGPPRPLASPGSATRRSPRRTPCRST